MNIYKDGDDGAATVDLDAATTELKATSLIQNDEVRRQRMSEISAAALLDIALSLRVVAAEARAAMPELGTIEYVEGDDEPDESDFLVVGDLVTVDGHDEPAKIVDFGVSEGAVWAEVNFASGASAKVWHDTLTRLRDDEAIAAEAGDDEHDAKTAEEHAADLLDEIEPADLVDDIDADFGDESHPAAESAVDVLRANEAARKAAKKGKKK